MAHKRGSVADRMAFFRKAIEEEKKMSSRAPRRPVSADFTNNNVVYGGYRPKWQPPSQLQMQKEKQEKEEKTANEKQIEGASQEQEQQEETIKERKTEKVVSQRKE